MRYVSTRGTAPVLTFEDTMLTGLARDGGLYVPETIPQMDAAAIAALEGQSYEEIAYRVMRPFVGDTLAALRQSVAAEHPECMVSQVVGADCKEVGVPGEPV